MRDILKKIVVAVLSWEAKITLARHKPKIVAVTGSVGKTGTKDAIYTAIAHKHFARKSEKSFNSEFGVPLTILGLPTGWSSPLAWVENMVEGLLIAFFSKQYPEWLVLEVGADRPGDIQRLAWIAPQIVVYTQFPNVPVHVEFFSSPEAVIEEKRSLGTALRKTGTLITNADDPNMQDEPVTDLQQQVRYGFSEHADVRASDVTVVYEGGKPKGLSAIVQFQNQSLPLTLWGCIGVHQLYPLLAALSTRVAEGVSLEHALEAVREHVPPPGRMRILEGHNGAVIIDDSYNASPTAVLAGLEALRTLECRGRTIVVIGDMLELGDHSTAQHRGVGEAAVHMCDVFIAVGVRMRAGAESVERRDGARVKEVYSVKEAWEAIDILKDMHLGEGDVVFVKGSQTMRMERVIESLLLDPNKAPFLLVRQDKEWLSR